MSDKSIPTQCITPEFRVSYPAVFQAKLNKLSGKTQYSLVALFKKGEDLSKLEAAAKAACKKKWGDDPKKWPKKLRSPFRDQAEREREGEDGEKFMPDGYEKGAKFLTLTTTQQPGIVDQKRQPILDAEKFYAGCWARASVNAGAYDTAGNQGVAFYLNNLQLVRDDDPFSGRRKAEEEFAAIEVADSADASEVDNPFAD